jgi:hypothetical protein
MFSPKSVMDFDSRGFQHLALMVKVGCVPKPIFTINQGMIPSLWRAAGD